MVEGMSWDHPGRGSRTGHSVQPGTSDTTPWGKLALNLSFPGTQDLSRFPSLGTGMKIPKSPSRDKNL